MKKDNRKAKGYQKKPTMNGVTATGITGRFKGDQIEVIFGKSYQDTIIKVNGKKIDLVQAVYLKCVVGQVTKMTLEVIPVK